MKNYSRKREAILAKLCETTSHPNAEWIYQEIKAQHPDISLATVYRNLRLFKEEGIIASVGVVAGQERFDAVAEPHGHFICRLCDAVIDVDIPLPSLDIERLQSFLVQQVDITLHGTCQACLRAS